MLGLARRPVHRDPLRLAGPGRSSSSPARGSATGSRGSRCAPSTPSAVRCSARSPYCSSRGRSVSPSPGPASAAITALVRSSAVLAKVDQVLPAEADKVLHAFNNVVGTTLLPALPRAVRARADRRGRPGTAAAADRSRRRRAAAQRAQDPRHQRLRQRRRGHRLRLRRRPADDQRPRRRGRQRARGRDRRRHRRRRGRPTTTPTSTSPCSPSTPAASPTSRSTPRPSRERRRRHPRLPPGRPVRRPGRPDPRRAAAALARHLRRGHRHPRGVLAARPGPARQLGRPDRDVRPGRGGRGVRGVGHRPGDRLRADRRARSPRARRAGSTTRTPVDTGDCVG